MDKNRTCRSAHHQLGVSKVDGEGVLNADGRGRQERDFTRVRVNPKAARCFCVTYRSAHKTDVISGWSQVPVVVPSFSWSLGFDEDRRVRRGTETPGRRKAACVCVSLHRLI